MKHPIKIIVKKPKQTRGDWAFYKEVDRILLDDNSKIKTEAQFCFYMYKKYGEGRIQCLAFQKGHQGFWLFWLGNLHSNGFIRDLHKNKELEKLKQQFTKSKSYEEKGEIEEEIQFEKEISGEENKYKRRGPINLIKSRPGILNQYEEY